MLLHSVIGLAVAGLSFANPIVVKDTLYPRSEQDLQAAQDVAAIKGLLTVINTALTQGDALVAGFTAENAESQTAKINTLLKQTGPKLTAAAQKIESSGPIGGITSVIGLLSPGQKLIKSANSTMQHLKGNIEVIRASGQAPKLVEGVNSLKPGVKALVKALPGQIPASMKETLKSKGAGATGGADFKLPDDKQVGELVDQAFEAINALLKGEPLPEFTLPAGLSLPPGIPTELLKGKGGASPADDAAPPADAPAKEPAAVPAPKVTAKPKSPKGTATPKGTTAPKGTASPKATSPKAKSPPKAKSTGSAAAPTAASHGAHGHSGMEGMEGMRK